MPRAPSPAAYHATPWRGVLLTSALAVAATLGIAAWFLPRVPPNCADPRTIALLHAILRNRFDLPYTVEPAHIHTRAGGLLALLFVCQADLAGLDPASLPAGPVPHTIDYTSRLVDGRHQVDATLAPALKWEKVE